MIDEIGKDERNVGRCGRMEEVIDSFGCFAALQKNEKGTTRESE